jgi:hypothetical protein
VSCALHTRTGGHVPVNRGPVVPVGWGILGAEFRSSVWRSPYRWRLLARATPGERPTPGVAGRATGRGRVSRATVCVRGESWVAELGAEASDRQWRGYEGGGVAVRRVPVAS